MILFFYRRGACGMFPCHVAAVNGYLECLKKLFQCMDSFDIDVTDDYGRTSLHGAACSGLVCNHDIA